jgi:hypothetical protein
MAQTEFYLIVFFYACLQQLSFHTITASKTGVRGAGVTFRHGVPVSLLSRIAVERQLFAGAGYVDFYKMLQKH